MNIKSILYGLFFLLASSIGLSAAQKNSSPPRVILCGIQHVLLVVDLDAMPGARAGTFFGYSPDVIETELYQTMWQVPFKFRNTTTHSPLMCYWLSTPGSSNQVKEATLNFITHNFWLLKKVRLTQAAEYAFTPEKTALVLKPNTPVVSLMRTCKEKGYTMVLCSNWNKESFQSIAQRHATTFSLFDHSYISGFSDCMTADKKFFERIARDLQVDPHQCILIDQQPDSLKAARSVGMKAIAFTTSDALSTSLKKYKVL